MANCKSGFRAENVTVAWGERRVLDGVTMEMEPYTVTVMAGPNGAGKSTLLRLLAGDLRATEGEVYFDGCPVNSFKPSVLARYRAVLPQESNLCFHFRVIEVVLLGRLPHNGGSESEEDTMIARLALESVGLADLSDRLYTSLSGGEKQRVQAARVFAQVWDPPEGHTPALLLDEPTANLDLAHVHSILRFARQFATRGGTALVILQDLDLALRYADQVALLHEGRLAASGKPLDILKPRIIQEVFGVGAELVKGTRGGPPHVVTFPID